LTVAPDRKTVVINWQLTGIDDAVRMTSAGVFGPATKDQVKPMSKGMLLDMGIMNPGQGQTLVRRVKVQSDHMEDALTFMREGRAYVRVAHEHGELRGQLVVPHCLDGDLNGTDQHYGFANIMVSPDPEDKSTAILVQAAPDEGVTSMTASLEVVGAGLGNVATAVRQEIKADAPVEAGLQYTVLYNSTQNDAIWTALSHPAREVNVVVNRGAQEVLTGKAAKAKACRLLSTVEDTLFTTATAFGNDWLSVWSMNPGNPDHRRTLTARYYAHPLEVTSGETAEQIMRRFGVSERELVRANPAIMDLRSLQVGDTVCVVPNFRHTVSGNGAKICV